MSMTQEAQGTPSFEEVRDHMLALSDTGPVVDLNRHSQELFGTIWDGLSATDMQGIRLISSSALFAVLMQGARLGYSFKEVEQTIATVPMPQMTEGTRSKGGEG
jgi:hypothetical protein